MEDSKAKLLADIKTERECQLAEKKRQDGETRKHWNEMKRLCEIKDRDFMILREKEAVAKRAAKDAAKMARKSSAKHREVFILSSEQEPL